MTKPLKPVEQRKTKKSTITSKKNLAESTTTSSTQKQENIVRNFENLQKHENLQKRNPDITESGIGGGRKEMKARVKVLEQGTGVRD